MKTGINAAEQYVEDVLSGKVLTGESVRLTVRRHAEDLRRSLEDPSFPFVFDRDAAEHVLDFIQMFCCHSVGEWAGQPFLLEPWQQFIVASIFGWKRRKDNLRRFKTVMIHVARKAGKIQLLAAIGLYMLIGDGELVAECYSAATKK